MPDVYGPFDGVTWQQSQWYRDAFAREMGGVYGTAFASASAGDLGLTVSGLTVTMALGRAHVRGAGYERTGTAWSDTRPANTNANPRVDRLVLRRDLAAKTVVPTILQGTPAVTPAAPAPSFVEDGVWDLPLFRFTVPANSGAPITGVIDDRLPSELTLQLLAGGPDTDWQALTVGGAYTANGTPAVRKIGKRVQGNAGIVGTGLAATTTYTAVMTIPAALAAFRPDRAVYAWAGTSSVATLGRFVINTDGTIDLLTGAAVSTYYRLDPCTWLTA